METRTTPQVPDAKTAVIDDLVEQLLVCERRPTRCLVEDEEFTPRCERLREELDELESETNFSMQVKIREWEEYLVSIGRISSHQRHLFSTREERLSTFEVYWSLHKLIRSLSVNSK